MSAGSPSEANRCRSMPTYRLRTPSGMDSDRGAALVHGVILHHVGSVANYAAVTEQYMR